MLDATQVATQVCTKCETEKPITDYYINRPGQHRRECKPCHLAGRAVWREANKPMLRKLHFGITDEQYADLLARQDGVCAICKRPETQSSSHGTGAGPLQVNHDHRCCSGRHRCGACVRGLLCGRCNRALGLLQEDPELVAEAARYLAVSRR